MPSFLNTSGKVWIRDMTQGGQVSCEGGRGQSISTDEAARNQICIHPWRKLKWCHTEWPIFRMGEGDWDIGAGVSALAQEQEGFVSSFVKH